MTKNPPRVQKIAGKWSFAVLQRSTLQAFALLGNVIRVIRELNDISLVPCQP
jgi:hypothetical protein